MKGTGPDLFRRPFLRDSLSRRRLFSCRRLSGRIFCTALLLLAGTGLFAQPGGVRGGASSGSVMPVLWDFSPSFDVFKPVPLADTETDPGDETITAGKPQWVKDLRRAEIVAFGSFPFTLFFTRTFIDLYRTAVNGWDRRYAPWPFKGAGAIAMESNQVKMMFAIAVSASLAISVTDYIIVRYKRAKAAAASSTTPFIGGFISTPMDPVPDESAGPDTEVPSASAVEGGTEEMTDDAAEIPAEASAEAAAGTAPEDAADAGAQDAGTGAVPENAPAAGPGEEAPPDFPASED